MSIFNNIRLSTIGIIILAIVIIAVIYIRISKKFYGVCPNCKKTLKSSPWRLIFTVHIFNKFYVKCPYCGEYGLKRFEEEK